MGNQAKTVGGGKGRMAALRAIGLSCLLALAGCAQSPGAGSPTQRIQAPLPPSGYVLIGESDTGAKEKIQVGIPDFDSAGDDGLTLSLFFGFGFVSAALDPTPAKLGTTGSGASVNDPIAFAPPVKAEVELDSTLNHLANRYPESRNIAGQLFRSPAARYLLRISFDTPAGANAVYYDITRWAVRRKEDTTW